MRPRPATPVALILSLLVCCGATSGTCNSGSNDQIGPSKGEVVGAAVGAVAVVAVVAVILVEVNHSHHSLKGCISSTPNGLELRTTENQTYALSGTTADIAPGSTVRVHGGREKHDKNATGDQVFLVQKMQKNYGPCQALTPAQPAAPPATQP